MIELTTQQDREYINPKYLIPQTKRHRALLKELGNSSTASMYIIRLRKSEKGSGAGERGDATPTVLLLAQFIKLLAH